MRRSQARTAPSGMATNISRNFAVANNKRHLGDSSRETSRNSAFSTTSHTAPHSLAGRRMSSKQRKLLESQMDEEVSEIMRLRRLAALEDARNDPDVAIPMQVEVFHYKRHRFSMSKSHTYFYVGARCGPESWQFVKTSADFSQLYETCMALSPDNMAEVKAIHAKFSKRNKMRERLKAYGTFLQCIASQAVFLDSPTFLRFMQMDSHSDKHGPVIEFVPQENDGWEEQDYHGRSNLVYFLKALLPDSGSSVSIGSLRIRVISGCNIPKMDLIGFADPYVKIFVGQGDEHGVRTKHINNTKNPVWNEEFCLKVNNATSTVRFEVWDADSAVKKLTTGLTGSVDTMIGFCTIPLLELAHEQSVIGDFYLQQHEDQDEEEEDAKGVDKRRKSLMTNIKNFDPFDPFGKKAMWKKHPPSIRLQFRYTYSKVGELASFIHPEPIPYSYAAFNVNLLYQNFMKLLVNIQPILDFLWEVYAVIAWDDPYFSMQVLVLFIFCCFHPWIILVLVCCGVIRIILTKYLVHVAKEEEKEIMVLQGIDPPEEEELTLGMAAPTLATFIKVSGYRLSCTSAQHRLRDANEVLDSIYGLFDWRDMNTTSMILKVTVGVIIYCFVLPVNWLMLVVGLYVLLMWTTFWKFVLGAIYFLGRRCSVMRIRNQVNARRRRKSQLELERQGERETKSHNAHYYQKNQALKLTRHSSRRSSSSRPDRRRDSRPARRRDSKTNAAAKKRLSEAHPANGDLHLSQTATNDSRIEAKQNSGGAGTTYTMNNGGTGSHSAEGSMLAAAGTTGVRQRK